MDGFDLFVISGIDGDFSEFDSLLGDAFSNITVCKLPYDRHLPFKKNIEKMSSIIQGNNAKSVIFGWSIGAVAAGFLSECNNVSSVVLLNPFFDRQEVLMRRNIKCDEQVCFAHVAPSKTAFTVLRGELDDRIPPSESERILEHLNLDRKFLYSFPQARHNLGSFPAGRIVDIIRQNL